MNQSLKNQIREIQEDTKILKKVVRHVLQFKNAKITDTETENADAMLEKELKNI